LVVDELNTRGYSVVAVGNESSWSRELKDVIDYSGSKYRTQLRDVSTGAISSLYAGSEADPSILPKLFRIPQLIANNQRSVELSTSSQLQLHLFKEHMVSGRVLTHSEIWRQGLAEFEHDGDLDSSVLLNENSLEEICDVLIDLLQIMESSKRQAQLRLKASQRQFWSTFGNGLELYPMLARNHGELRALISPSFL